MKSNGKEHLRLIKTFSSLSMSRSCPKKGRIFHLRAPVFLTVPSTKYLAYSCSCGFTQMIYTICPHDHVSVNVYRSMCILYACIGLHPAMQCFVEFKRVRDLWTELDVILTFISVFCSIGFLRLNR